MAFLKMKKIRIANYTPKSGDKFLFDNNIWMYLYCPIGSFREAVQDSYSNFFQKILDIGAKIFVPSLVLSEFTNKYFHLDFKIWCDGEDKNFKKDYRISDSYKNTVEDISMRIESQILAVSNRIDDDFSEASIKDIYRRFEYMGFNDSYYVELGKIYDLMIVTNDTDFLNVEDEVTILTIN